MSRVHPSGQDCLIGQVVKASDPDLIPTFSVGIFVGRVMPVT